MNGMDIINEIEKELNSEVYTQLYEAKYYDHLNECSNIGIA